VAGRAAIRALRVSDHLRGAGVDVWDKESPSRLVNPGAWPAYRARFDAIMGLPAGA
jgi:hypothetical protein